MKTIQKTAQAPNTALWRARRKSGLERKQAAWILGHKSPDALARYERGPVEPNFDNAVKLSIIYGCALEDLFPLKYATFRQELSSKVIAIRSHSRASADSLLHRMNICSYEQTLLESNSKADFPPHVRDHVTKLARLLAGL
jgi:DNA-binding XRE family transcriptional regulator